MPPEIHHDKGGVHLNYQSRRVDDPAQSPAPMDVSILSGE